MIELHGNAQSDETQNLIDRFKELSLAYKFVSAAESPHRDDVLPIIIEGSDVFRSKEEIDRFFDELSRDLSVQRSISGDSCYIDPRTGKTC